MRSKIPTPLSTITTNIHTRQISNWKKKSLYIWESDFTIKLGPRTQGPKQSWFLLEYWPNEDCIDLVWKQHHFVFSYLTLGSKPNVLLMTNKIIYFWICFGPGPLLRFNKITFFISFIVGFNNSNFLSWFNYLHIDVTQAKEKHCIIPTK